MVTWRIGSSRFEMLALVALLAFGTSACGFIFSHGPPDGYEQMASFDCTTDNTGPILDLVWAGLNVAGALNASSNPQDFSNSGQIVTVGLSWGVVSTISAATGFSKSKRCRNAKLQLAQREGRGLPPRIEPLFGDSIVQAVVIQPLVDTVVVGEQVQLVAAAHNSSGSVVPNQLFVWSSSNDAIASVSLAGLVSSHAPGSVVIAARAASIVGIASVVVVARR
jgi:hypothetical protein